MEKYRDTFTNYTDDHVMWDERKRRFVYLDNATIGDVNLYSRNYFKFPRPDYVGVDQNDFKVHVKLG